MADPLNDTVSTTASVSETAPLLDNALKQTRDFLTSIQQFHKDHEEFERKASRKLKDHSQIKEKCKAAEAEHQRARQAHDDEVKAHQFSKSKVNELEKGSLRLQDEIKLAGEDLAAVKLENEALRVEMEAKRQAFVVNLNLAGRHADLRARHDEITEECERLRSEHVKLQRELESVHGRLAKVAELEEQIQRDRLAKKRGRQKVLHALERSLAKNDQGLLQSVVLGWHSYIQDEKKKKAKKDKAMERGMRAIAGSNAALMQIVFNDWVKVFEEQRRCRLMDEKGRLEAEHGCAGSAAERARQKAMAQLEKQWGASNRRLQEQVIEGIRQVRTNRLKMEKNKAGALRGIASSDNALKATIMGSWGKMTRDSRAAREKKDQSMARAMKMIGGHENTLKGTIVNMWQRLTRTNKEAKDKKNEGNAKAMRMIANSSQAVVAAVFQGWSAFIKKEKDKAKKLKAVERNLVSAGQGMVAYVLQNWAKYTQSRSAMRKRKDQNMQRALKSIDGSALALQNTVLQQWLRVVEKVKQDRLIEEGKKAQEHMQMAKEAEEALATTQGELKRVQAEAEELRRLRCEERPRLLQAESKIDDLLKLAQARERQLIDANQELQESRAKAASITEELAKVGMFIQNTPRLRSRPPSGGKVPSDGEKERGAKDDTTLPRIDSHARPRSGRNSGKYAWGGDTAR